jgi:3-hydroxyisobutyrate dehydrogenase-like beta-hydroxyacid dehydrogenase
MAGDAAVAVLGAGITGAAMARSLLETGASLRHPN